MKLFLFLIYCDLKFTANKKMNSVSHQK